MTLDAKEATGLIVAVLRGRKFAPELFDAQRETLAYALADDLEAGRLVVVSSDGIEALRLAQPIMTTKAKQMELENIILREVAKAAKDMDACNEGWLNCSPGNECQDDHAEHFRGQQEKFHEALAKLEAAGVKLWP